MLSVSPDYCVNMIQYWLGDYRGGRFDLQSADGPFVLDLGDIMYAPNILTDKQVSRRDWPCVWVAWLAWLLSWDKRQPGCAVSGRLCCWPDAGCLSMHTQAMLCVLGRGAGRVYNVSDSRAFSLSQRPA
jgi:hypothetical protein